MQLVSSGAKDIYLSGNPQCGVPLYGHSEGRALNSNPSCSSLEFSWIEKSIENKIDYTTFFTSDYTIGEKEPININHDYYMAWKNVEIITPELDKNYEKNAPINMRRKKIKYTYIPNDDPFQTIETIDDVYVKKDRPDSYYSRKIKKFKTRE